MPAQKSFSVDELNHLRHLNQLTESELKRQLSHDLANDPALATVFNPPQVFSDENGIMENGMTSNPQHDDNRLETGAEIGTGQGSSVVVHWTNSNDLIVSLLWPFFRIANDCYFAVAFKIPVEGSGWKFLDFETELYLHLLTLHSSVERAQNLHLTLLVIGM